MFTMGKAKPTRTVKAMRYVMGLMAVVEAHQLKSGRQPTGSGLGISVPLTMMAASVLGVKAILGSWYLRLPGRNHQEKVTTWKAIIRPRAIREPMRLSSLQP